MEGKVMMTTKEIIEKAVGRKYQSSQQPLQFYYDSWKNWWDTVIAPVEKVRIDRIERVLVEKGFLYDYKGRTKW
jgi:hypothetical protein